MKINEVEKVLDIPKASIRFYEKEGLLNPKRNSNFYREYSEEDIEVLKKIIVLRKIGMPVENIKMVLNDQLSLKDALTHNIDSLHQQMKELEGALNLCEMICAKDENLASFDEEYYWKVIHEEEKNGNKFFDIMNDVIEFEKHVIGDEFGLLDQEGNMKHSPKKSILIALVTCVGTGLLWFFLDGMNIIAFRDGLIFPLICIVISSVIGLPVFFLEKKNKKAATVIKRIGKIFAVVFLIVVVLLMIFLNV